MSEAERLLAQCPWKEYSDGGKTYYNNTETKESVWTIPKELKELKDKLTASKDASDKKTEEEKSALEAAMAATLAALEPPAGEPKRDSSKEGRESTKGGNRAGSSEKQMVFKDKKEAMEALKELLRERNVPSTANWEAAVKAISKDPRYEYLSKLTEKKQGWTLT